MCMIPCQTMCEAGEHHMAADCPHDAGQYSVVILKEGKNGASWKVMT